MHWRLRYKNKAFEASKPSHNDMPFVRIYMQPLISVTSNFCNLLDCSIQYSAKMPPPPIIEVSNPESRKYLSYDIKLCKVCNKQISKTRVVRPGGHQITVCEKAGTCQACEMLKNWARLGVGTPTHVLRK